MKYNFDELIERKGTNSLKYDGKSRYFGTDDIMPLWVADMDFRTPHFIMDAIKRRCEHEILGYTLKTGIFFNSLINWLSRRFDWNVPEESICFTPGVVSALNFGVLAFTNPGDRVIVQSPVYAPFYTAVKDHNRELAINPLKLVDGRYEMDLVHFESLIDNRTKLFILCSPHNPVSRVWSRDELLAVGEICLKHNITILSDEIHSDLVFKPHKHQPLAQLSDELANITITSMAPSKTFNIAGLSSSAAIITNPELRKKFLQLPNSCHLGSGNLFGLTAFEAAYTYGDDWLEQMLEYLWRNVVYLRKYLAENIPPIKLIEPEGTYLLWLDFREFGLPDRQIKEILVNKAKVGFNYGPDFGPGGEGFQRINIGCPRQTLKEALEKVKNAFI
jgi:cysteine-S-conjugate beta-lyase